MIRRIRALTILAAGLCFARPAAAATQAFWSAQCTRFNISGSCTGDTVTVQTPTAFEDVECTSNAYQWISAPGQVSAGQVIHVFTPAQQDITVPACSSSAPALGGGAGVLFLGAALGIAGLIGAGTAPRRRVTS